MLLIIFRGTSESHNGKEKEGCKEDYKEAKGFQEETSIVLFCAYEKTAPARAFFLA